MRRRLFLTAAAGGLVALIGAGAGVWSRVPSSPNAPIRTRTRHWAGSGIRADGSP